MAMMFGVGAISTGGANAHVASIDTSKPSRTPQHSDKAFGEVRVWSDHGRIYLLETGGTAQQLQLSDTPEAQRLRALLERSGATEVRPQVLQHRIILVGGGGDGFHMPARDTSAGPTQRSTEPTPPPGHHAPVGPENRTRAVDPGARATPGRTTDGGEG